MTHLLHGFVLFIAAVFGHWQTWLSGGGVGGFVVVATSLIEKLTGKTLSRKMHLGIFVIAFFLGSCLLAWIDEHDRAEGLQAGLASAISLNETAKRNCEIETAKLSKDAAVKDAVGQTLQKQNLDQQNTINGCLSQAIKMISPVELIPTVLTHVRWPDNRIDPESVKKEQVMSGTDILLLVNRPVTCPCDIVIVVDQPLLLPPDFFILGAGMMTGVGSQFQGNVGRIHIEGPSILPTRPLMVTAYTKRNIERVQVGGLK